MTIKYDYLGDGTAFEAAEFNTRFSVVYEGINSLCLDDLSLGAFRYNHLPMLICLLLRILRHVYLTSRRA